MAESTWLDEAKKNSGLLIFLGILTVIFGVVAITTPFITGLAVTLFVGAMLAVSGVAQIVHAFKCKQWGTGFWGTVIGLLGLAAGLYMLFRPGMGLITLAMVLAIYFLVDGISEIIAAFKIKPDQGWAWVLFNGIIAVLLGFMIWRQWPASGAWAVGLLVGVHILLSGWTMIILGTGARRVADAVEDAVDDAVDSTGDAAESAFDKAKDFAGDVAEKAEDVADKAKDLAEDVADKAEDMVDRAEDAVEDAVDKAKDTFDRDKD